MDTHKMRKHILFIFILFFALNVTAQHIAILQQGKPTSIRGLSVVDDHVAWISGSKGALAITTDGGKTWEWQQVKGFEKADFRDIEAFSDKQAIIMSSGTPALILKTTDGGKNWQVKYRNADTAYFFDAMDFSDDRHGYVLGDPIRGKFVLLETKNSGDTWLPVKNPPDALPGEAAFAASGTCLRLEKGRYVIVTGGSHSRVISSQTNPIPVPLLHGRPSQGAFSIAFSKTSSVIVGGDYSKDQIRDSVAFYFSSKTGNLSKKQPAGFQSCVEYILDKTFISTGTSGSNITMDGGQTWTQIDGASYNVCRKAKRGQLVLFAGNDGKIGIFKP
jgi:photosystem II stability/assembly factor-like uncharacterized protein